MRFKNRKGFALPMSILIIAVLTAALAASFSSTSAEYTNNAAERAQTRAYNLAETGLEQFMVLRSQSGWCAHCGDPIQVDSEWTRVSLPGGYADVVAVKVRPAVDSLTPAVYFIRSKGTDTSVKLIGDGGASHAEHIVGVFAKWQTATMKVNAAWVSLSGLVKNGAGTISGVDACGQQASVAGSMVPKGDIVINGGSSNFQGTPPVDTSNSLAQLEAKVGIDWNGIVNQNAMPADIEIPPSSFPSTAAFSDTSYWPVIRIHTNNYSLPNAGRGIIIADSNFTISGSNMWSGIVLVGGKLTSNGNNTTYGATLSGLNFLLGGTPDTASTGDDATANGQKTYVYNSCSVSKATTKMRKYLAIPNSWMDNLASW